MVQQEIEMMKIHIQKLGIDVVVGVDDNCQFCVEFLPNDKYSNEEIIKETEEFLKQALKKGIEDANI